MGKRKCPTCGSKQWRKEPLSGLIACSEGHILQSYRNETTEVQELGPHAVRKRDIKGGKEKKRRVNETDPKLYHGARGRYHYLLCLQLILRKQIAVLVRVWDLPAEYEILCKDLWTLHLSMLPEAVPDEMYQEKEGQEMVRKGKEQTRGSNEGRVGVDQTDDEAPSGLYDYDDEGESEVDSELEALLRENSDFSSSDSEDNEKGMKKVPESVKRVKDKRRHARLSYETPVNTVAVLVVACWTLRIPVMYRDFTRLIERYELPYLDPLRCLPSSMVQHLTKHNLRALSPHAANVMSIHRAASRLCRRLKSHYGIITPEANGASILWRVTREMAFTPLVYMMTKRVASERSLALLLHPAVGSDAASGTIGHVFDNVPAEVQCVAALIIVLKMVYGLDGKPRDAIDALDVACGVPRKSESMKVLGELIDDERKKRQVMFGPENMVHIGDMDEEKMDEYIEYCRQLLVRDEADSMLDGYFPMQGVRLPSREEEEGLSRRGPFSGPVTGGQVERLGCGDKYKTWNEVVGAEYSAVLERASTVTGVMADYINGTVGRLDRVRRLS